MTNQPRARLKVCNGKQVGQVFSLLETDRKVLGRDNNCHIQILDKGISRNHSLVEWQGDCFVLSDLGSTNGTFVNNQTIISKTLHAGDVVKIGQTELQYEENKSAQRVSNVVINDEDVLTDCAPGAIMERVDVCNSLNISSANLTAQSPGEKAVNNLYLSTIYEVSNLVNAEHDLDKLFAAIMDKIMDVFKPNRGFLVLREENELLAIKVARNPSGRGEARLSQTILNRTIKEGISVLSANAMLDDRFSAGMSIVSQEIKSVMSVPLEGSQKILGAIYVDSIDMSNRFKRAHLDLLTAIGKQAGVAIERNMLFAHYVESEKIKQELKIAQNIQKSLLPRNTPENFMFDLVGWSLTCDETGGDYYDYFPLGEDRLGLAIGDVSGHGIGAALLMASARAFVKALARKSDGIPSMMNELNKLLAQDMDADKFMTLFYCELDTQKLLLQYASAGHDGPLLYHKHTSQFQQLESTGIPLGMMEDFSYEDQVQVKIFPGDILILSTDGITESMNKSGEQFGIERMAQVIKNNCNKTANQIIRDCYDELQTFCQGTPQRDDLTLVILKFDMRQDTKKF